MFLRLFAFSSCALFLALSGSHAAPFSLVYEKARWPQDELRVCFGDESHYPLTVMRPENDSTTTFPKAAHLAPIPEKFRPIIRSVIDREFSAKRTEIHFSGWTNCTADAANADVVVFMSRADYVTGHIDGQASIGPGLDTDDGSNARFHSGKGFVFLTHPEALRSPTQSRTSRFQTTPEESLQITVLHEFGHLVGLGHEYLRIYRGQADWNCQITNSEYAEEVRSRSLPAFLGPNTVITGDYDPNSIMNDCWMSMIELVTGTDFVLDRSVKPILLSDPRDPVDSRAHPTVLSDYPSKDSHGALPANAVNLTDRSLYRSTSLGHGHKRIALRIGLSQGDLHAIRCIYRPEKESLSRSCRHETPKKVDLPEGIRPYGEHPKLKPVQILHEYHHGKPELEILSPASIAPVIRLPESAPEKN